MARAIDSEAAYRFLSEQFVKETGAFSKGVNKGLNIARSAMRNPDAIPALRPVSREQVEKVFPGCPACKNGSPKIHIPAFRAMAVCNQHMDHEAFDIELNSKFCLNCGRPMTDEAVDMVMERLEELHENR